MSSRHPQPGSSTPRLGHQATPRQQPPPQPQLHKPAYPVASPWRAKQQGSAPLVDAVLRSGTPSGQPQTGANGQAVNLPSLPRLGSQNTAAAGPASGSGSVPGPGPIGPGGGTDSPKPLTAQDQHQQLSQHPQSQTQQQPPGYASPGYGLRAQGPTFAQVAQQGMMAKPPPALQQQPRLPSRADAATGLMGSHMMSVMTPGNSLNTVLPGLDKAPGGPSGSTGVPGMPGTPGPHGAPGQAAMYGSREDFGGQGAPIGSGGVGLSGSGASAANGGPPKTDMDRYGVKSLLSVLHMDGSDPRAAAALGTDMTHLGLNLGGTGDERLSRTFASPWQETPFHAVIPDFQLPDCYNIPNVVPQQQKLQNLNEETLFYIFYTMPRDAMQEAVAVELTNRNWRYHKELKMWLTKDPMSEPVQTGSQAEQGIYIFFDPTSWEKVKKEYVLYYPDIA